MTDFKDKNVLIIGASSGIGLSLAKKLTEVGANLYSASRNESDELKELDTTFLQLDVTDDFEEIEGLPDTIHALAYCPGTINLKPFQSLSLKDFDSDLQINVLGAVKVLKASMKALKKAKGASVVLFSTVATKVGINFHASIAVAKSGVEGLAKTLAAEWSNQNIRVNVIAPSLTDTPLAANLLSSDDKKEASAKRHPLKRYGSPEDISAAAEYLLSDDSSWVTGQILALDGGLSGTRGL